MEIEKQRGISVTSSVMQFEYDGYCINILDTPGHQDFSEDTYRTLMAADSAVMVIDASKGVEAADEQAFQSLRDAAISRFSRSSTRWIATRSNPFDLLDEIEKELGIGTYPMNWPIGSGVRLQGRVTTAKSGEILAFEGDNSQLARSTRSRSARDRSERRGT